MEFVSTIFETLGQIAADFGGLLVQVFDAVVDLFWVEAEGGTGGSLTVLGTFLLISSAVGLFIWAFSYIRRLIRVKA